MLTLPSTLEVLIAWDETVLKKLIAKLERDGLVSDEDSLGLSSMMVKEWNLACTEFLAARGYTGGKIKTHAKFYDHVGNVYVLFDGDRWGLRDAQAYMDAIAQRHAVTNGSA